MKTIKGYNISDIMEKNRKLITGLFFILYLFAGSGIFKDYGVSWDEKRQRDYGCTVYNYVVHGKKELLNEYMRFYGPVFEFALFSMEKVLGLRDSREIYFARHLANFLIFYLGVFFFYKLCKYRFGDWKRGLAGSLFLILSPRIFADSFYNSKDIPFLAVFIISIYTLIGYLNKKTVTRALFHALSCAILISLRVTGIILPVFTLIFFAGDMLFAGDKKNKNERIFIGFLWYPLLTVAFTILFWPTLWQSPVFNFSFAVYAMGHYPWPGKILYLGDFVKAKNLPWHYVPVWIALSTPFIYLLLFAVGLGGFLTGLVKKCEGFYKKQRDDIIFALWFFAPLSAVVILKSTLYNGWRQMFFIYPALLIFSVAGLSFLLKFVRMRSPALGQSIAAGFLVIFIATVVASMIKMHPYQNVYFNFLAGKSETVEKSFERDYWGLSYRKGLEYILSRDSSRLIKICADDAGQNNAGILPVKERSRLVFTEKPEGTDYFLGNFRGQKGGYHYGKEYYSIKAGNIEILAVYLMRLRRVQARSAPGEAVVKLIPPQRGGM